MRVASFLVLAMTGLEWKPEDVAVVVTLVVIYFALPLCAGLFFGKFTSRPQLYRLGLLGSWPVPAYAVSLLLPEPSAAWVAQSPLAWLTPLFFTIVIVASVFSRRPATGEPVATEQQLSE